MQSPRLACPWRCGAQRLAGGLDVAGRPARAQSADGEHTWQVGGGGGSPKHQVDVRGGRARRHNNVPRRMESVGGRRWPGRAPVLLWRGYEGEAPGNLEKLQEGWRSLAMAGRRCTTPKSGEGDGGRRLGPAKRRPWRGMHHRGTLGHRMTGGGVETVKRGAQRLLRIGRERERERERARVGWSRSNARQAEEEEGGSGAGGAEENGARRPTAA
jgi:hypothetical protein